MLEILLPFFLVSVRRRKGVYGPQMGKNYIVFVDDVNVPQGEQFGAKPPVEFLRQWLDHNSFYDTKDGSKVELVNSVRSRLVVSTIVELVNSVRNKLPVP